ncbi:MAG: regulator of sigma E protease [Saprospiraceae bacterium]|jgi:regulator of sigma E protease|tara:strand:+ start:1214 stop:2548 length:1335 start_codon:yes stop_codon:yes gene_type:complete
MGIISIAAQLILSLSILVVLHECGHFFPAKWFKTRVEKFYLFFNPGFSLFKKQIGETEYGIGWIPFGGYVKISGMIDESMDTEQMEQEPQPWEFRSKPAWQRLVIMLGGVTVNFVLGFLIFAGMMWYWGETYYNASDLKYGVVASELGKDLGIKDGDHIISIGDVKFERYNPGIISQEIVLNDPEALIVNREGKEIALPIPVDMAEKLTKYENKGVGLFAARLPQRIAKVTGGAAKKAGMKAGDQIIEVNGINTFFLRDFSAALEGKKEENVNFTVLRNERDTLNLSATLSKKGELGIFNVLLDGFAPEQKQKYSLGQAIPKGVDISYGFLTGQLKAFKQMFAGKIKATDSLGSVFSIAKMFDESWNWEQFWKITAMLSILLGFFNLLPIPALDGGYVMFLIWEVVTGRKPNDKFMEYATMVGFFILIGLMIFALGLDVSKWFK